MPIKRAAIFAHYTLDDKVADYVIAYLQGLASVADYILVVSTAQLSLDQQLKLKNHCQKLILRPNQGYDFHSYRAGILALNLKEYQQLILCNDSCYGPLIEFKQIFASMAPANYDCWGLTSTNLIKFHLQSYFLVINCSIFNQSWHAKFWQELPLYHKRKQIIKKCEIGYSQLLLKHHARLGSLVPLHLNLPKSLLFKRNWHLIIKQYLNRNCSGALLSNLLQHRRIEQQDKSLILWDYIVKEYQMPLVKCKVISLGIATPSEVNTLLKKHDSHFAINLIQELTP